VLDLSAPYYVTVLTCCASYKFLALMTCYISLSMYVLVGLELFVGGDRISRFVVFNACTRARVDDAEKT
jgi:hypothetical protein